MRKYSKSVTKVLLATIVLTAGTSLSAYAGEWKQDNGQWQYQNDDGTYVEEGWHWINGKCYSFYYDRQYNNPICDLNSEVNRYYTVDASGAWVFNGTVVEEGSELAQKLTGDNFSGTYISTYLEEDAGSYTDDSYRIDINMTTEPNEPPLFYLTYYDKNANGVWEKSNSSYEGVAGQSLDENGNPILLRDDNGFTSNPQGNIIIRFVKNGDTLQMIVDEGRITYQKQN